MEAFPDVAALRNKVHFTLNYRKGGFRFHVAKSFMLGTPWRSWKT